MCFLEPGTVLDVDGVLNWGYLVDIGEGTRLGVEMGFLSVEAHRPRVVIICSWLTGGGGHSLDRR